MTKVGVTDSLVPLRLGYYLLLVLSLYQLLLRGRSRDFAALC